MRNFTAGWNDPPVLDCSTLTNGSNCSSVRDLFARRVAFPMTESSAAPSSTNSGLVQTPFPYSASDDPYLVQDDHFIKSASTPCFLNDRQLIDHNGIATVNNIPLANHVPASDGICQSKEELKMSSEEILHIIRGAGYNNMTDAMKQNVEKKLNYLRSSLESNSLTENCRLKLCALVDDLKNKRFKEAYDAHSILMVEHYSEVSAWMVGLKAILMEHLKS